MTNAPRAHWKTDAALLFAVVVWGLNFPVLKAALAVMHPHVINALRFTISACVLGALFFGRQRVTRADLGAMLRTHGRKLLFLGLLGYVGYQLSFIIGIDHTTAGSAALIMAGAPLWTATIGRLLGYEYLRRPGWIGLLLSLGGTFTVVFGGAQEIDFGSSTFLGNVLMLAAAAQWGAYTALSKPMLRHVSPSGLAFFGLLVALPFLYGLSVPYVDQVKWQAVDAWVWAAIVYSGGLSTGLALVIWNVGVKQVGAAQTAIFNNLVPFVAVVASVLLLGESLNAAQLLGGALIIGGVILMRFAR